MYLYPPLAFDLGPPLFELILHLPPQQQRLSVNVLDTLLCLLLEQEQTEPSLDESRLLHEEFKLVVCCVCLVHAPVLLNGDGCELWPSGSLEHPGGDLDDLEHVVFINYAIE